MLSRSTRTSRGAHRHVYATIGGEYAARAHAPA